MLQALYCGKFLPELVFGVMSFLAGTFAFYLPETKHKKLPDTLKQAEVVGVEETN